MNEPLSSGSLDPLARVEGAVFLAYVTTCIQSGIHWQDCIAGGTSVAKGCRNTLTSFSTPQQGKSGAGEAPAPAPAARLPEQQGGNGWATYQILEMSHKPDRGKGPMLGIKLASHEVTLPADAWAHAFDDVYMGLSQCQIGDTISAVIDWQVPGFKKIERAILAQTGSMDATGRTITHSHF